MSAHRQFPLHTRPRVAAGIPGLVGAGAVAPGATVIDVGIHRGEGGLRGFDGAPEVRWLRRDA